MPDTPVLSIELQIEWLKGRLCQKKGCPFCLAGYTIIATLEGMRGMQAGLVPRTAAHTGACTCGTSAVCPIHGMQQT